MHPRFGVTDINPLTLILNHVSAAVIGSALTGAIGSGVGYLCSRIITPIDPRTAFVCGAAVGAVKILFDHIGSTTSSKIVGLALLVFAPFKICQRLELPATFKITVMLTTTVIAITMLPTLLKREKVEELY